MGSVSPLALRLFPFLAWRDRVTRATLRADLAAGLIGALVVLPQGVAYATLAGLPPQFGLYCAMLPATAGVAIEVPHITLYAFTGLLSVDVMPKSPLLWQPPATTIGLMRPSSVGPHELKLVIVLLFVLDAPT